MIQEEGPGDPSPTWAAVSDFARRAEEVGVDSLWLVDHFLWDTDPWRRDPVDYGITGETTSGYGVREAWTTLAALAATTSRVRIGTLVTCTRYRNPALLAKMADTVDEISGGRLVLGLGAGDYALEHERFGFPTDRPVAHFEEALAIIVPLLRTGAVDYEGQAYRAHVELKPRASRGSGPPIMIGSLGHGPRVLRLVATHADVWNGWLTHRGRASEIPPLRAAVDAACAEVGRDVATLRRSVVVAVAFEGPVAQRSGTITGTTEQVASQIAAFAQEGIDEVYVRLFPNDLRTLDRLGEVITLLPALDLSP